jgi:Domain of unknown function (DUF4126)
MTPTILSIFLGIGLASATGFRVFLPLFVLSLASYFDMWEISATFEWIGKLPALITLAIAMIAEIFAYYIPVVDNFLDTIAAPLAAIAGTIIMVSTVINLDPVMTWSLALIAGGGTATAMQGMTTLTRFASTVKTGGLANPIITTAETGTSIFLSVLSIFAPVFVVFFVVILLFITYKMYKKIKK